MTRNWDRLEYRNYGFSIWTSSTIGWTGWDDFVATTIGCVGFVMGTIGLVDSTFSTWMLSITLSKLGLGSSLMLPCVAIA